ncbi:MAG: GNAT family N-acetyltransferase [Acidimicrobiia bacterium]|nr:GNAT family N-acetyltransferase [Acidimicrobiia bacterium]MDH5236826.1 GNAT family N-acetyltransferase [Acidimicrobiia bacterium]
MFSRKRQRAARLVRVNLENPASRDAQFCIGEYFAELDQRFDTGFDPATSISADVGELIEPAGLLLVARREGRPIGCGALKFHAGQPVEIKRMWVSKEARGLGLGRRLLHELEAEASRRGATIVRLETNRSLAEAISLYRSAGYDEVPAFNAEPFAHHWFQKYLDRIAISRSDPAPMTVGRCQPSTTKNSGTSRIAALSRSAPGQSTS